MYNYPNRYMNQDNRFGGFLGPFILGGITGGVVAPYFWGGGRPNNYQQMPYYPPNNY